MDPERWWRVKQLLHSVLECEPESREAFLHSACNGDVDLRRVVERLLAKEAEADRFLETPAIACAEVSQAATVLFPGREFGTFQIVSALGTGGMGEVYRAHDSKLDRDVAIKTLPSEFAQDTERLRRLRREARVLASLNHPNIAAIYDIETFGDLECLVLELVEGETLHGPLPIAQALDCARQIAEALEAAHEKGIIHRDLKPANVKVTPQGKVKVLDFGLAKAVWGAERNPDASLCGAIGASDTLAGHILGTPGYMSPEQTRGDAVDKRADVWAFGCLLYELLTGKRAFPGDDVLDTIAAVLEREPDWKALPAKTPARIRRLLCGCLRKDVQSRLPGMAEVRHVLEQTRNRSQRQWAALIAATVVALAVGVTVWLQRSTRPPDRSEWVQLTKFPDPVSQPALSPDGRMLAFVRGPRTTYGIGQIYVKHLPDGEPLQRTQDTLKKANPTFSADGTRVAYTVVDPEFHWDTWAVPTHGGQPQPWLRNASGLTWIASRQLLFSEIKPHYPMGIATAGEDRTVERDVYLPINARGMATRSEASPDRKWVLIAEMSAYGNWDQCRVVPFNGSSRGWQIGPTGAPCSAGAWSRDGKWMYLTSKAEGLNHIWRQRFPDGQPQQLTFGITEEEGIAIAPDGTSLVTAVAMESSTLWIHDHRGERQISVLEGNAADPKFAPDGKKLYYRVVKSVQIAGTKRDPGEL